MTPTLHLSKGETLERALQKAATWFDRICDDKVAAFATAIGKADVSSDEMIAGIGQAQHGGGSACRVSGADSGSARRDHRLAVGRGK
jgi:hypothetical protein